jgi:predicted PurR-regulated permease PerM
MKLVDKINDTIYRDFSLMKLIKIILVMGIVWLFQATSGIWLGILNTVWSVIAPFVIGFVIAYIFRSPIRFGEEHGISRKIMIPLLYVLIALFIFWLIYSLVPMIVNRAGDFISSIINSMQWLQDKVSNISSTGSGGWLDSFVNEGVDALTAVKKLIPNLSDSLPHILTTAMSVLANAVIAIVVSIFMCFSWEKIRAGVAKVSYRVSKRCNEIVFAINEEESLYIRSLLILIILHFIEYSLLYLLVGHQDWLIMGLITGLALIVPYIGPTIANVIGIFTALSLPTGNVIFLVIAIVIMSSTDEYVLAPFVHSHNTHVTPLWAIFSVFAGGVLFGSVGVIIAIPVYLALRVIILRFHEDHEAQEKMENQK